VNGSSSNPVIVSKGGSKTITATVLDTLGATITGTFLTWSSSDPAIASVTSSGNVATLQAGGASIIASCTPPTCNIGILPILPIYPESVVDLIVTPTTATQSSTAYVASTGCGTTEGCVSATIPITTAASTTSPGTTVGAPINLPATPNSLVFDRQGKNAYLGTDRGELGTKGLMVLNATNNPATVSEFTSVTGKVLAISPDGNTVIVSDTLATPNQVFIFTSNSTSHSSTALNITGATAADFSPDNLKAYIVATDTTVMPNISTLYIYSTLEALQAAKLSVPATDVAFLANGMFGYMAGGDPAGVSFLPTCTAPPLVASLGSVPASGTTLLRALPDGVTMLALSPPDIQTFTASISGTLAIGQNGCPAPRGGLTVTNTPNPQGPFPLGAGDFVATQLLVAPDGSTAYVISGSVPKVIIFNISGHTSSSIALTGGATPIRATLTPDGTLLYVAANDGQVHLLSTVANSDILQISFPPGTTSQPTGLCSGVTFTCLPDLIAVEP